MMMDFMKSLLENKNINKLKINSNKKQTYQEINNNRFYQKKNKILKFNNEIQRIIIDLANNILNNNIKKKWKSN